MTLGQILRHWLGKERRGSEAATGLPSVTFATSVWEHDWRHILLTDDYLKTKQIENHRFQFAERLLVINNVVNPDQAKSAAEVKIKEGVLSNTVVADDVACEVLKLFHLARPDFKSERDNSNWLYFNALAPLTAIYAAKSEYLLYMTGDSRLDKPVQWIPKALQKLQGNSAYKVANLTWNRKYHEAREEADSQDRNFYIASGGFSDQLFLVKVSDFRQPIYGQIRTDASHFPHGDTFEKRCFSHMKNHGWIRLTYRHGSYTHKNI